MKTDYKYVVVGNTYGVSKRKKVAIFATRNISSYSYQAFTDLSSKLRDEFVFFLTYELFNRLKIRFLKNYEKLKIVVLISNVYFEKLKNLDKNIIFIVIEDPEINPQEKYLFKDLFLLEFVESLLILEATEVSKNIFSISRFASDIGKNVYCLPGKVYDPSSAGTNKLIYEGATPLYNFDLLI